MSKITYGAWVGLDEKAGEGNLQFQQVESKAADPDDIDVKILYCGLCGSDTSGLLGHFGPIMPPRVCGHEIVGTVVNVGPDVKNLKVSDLVGIGAQCDSCRECEWCKDHEEQHCANFTYTYGAPFSRGVAKGEICKGGFAKMWRGSARFAVPIPAGLDPAAAAPLLCGGVTVYSPLKAYGAGTTAKNVGIIGIDGLGHLGIMIAKAMGANVTAISRGTAKKDDALKLGAEKYIATTNNLTEDFKDHQRTLDLIICTINPSNLPITEYLTLLRPKGKIVLVGIVAKPLEIPTFSLIRGSKGVAASSIGSPNDLKEVLQLAADKGLQPWIQKYNFDDINRALVDFNKGLPKYRFVLANVDNGAKL